MPKLTNEADCAAFLAGELMQQIVAFGRIGMLSKPSPYMGQLIAVTRHWCQGIEKLKINSLLECNTPYIANQTDWSDDVPVGGYLGDAATPLASQFVRSYDLLWSLNIERGQAFAPLLRSALYVCLDQGFDAAVAYVVDVHRYGYVGGVKSMMRVLESLTWARHCEADEKNIAGLFFNPIPKTHAEWRNTPFQSDLSERMGNAGGDSQVAQTVLDRCYHHIERTRQSNNLTEWTLSQMNLATLLQAGLLVCKTLEHSPNIVTRALWDDVEEIMADSLSFFSPGVLLVNDLSMARNLANKFAELDSENWKDHIRDRCLVPNKLGHLIDDPAWLNHSKTIELPETWRLIQPDRSFPIMVAVRERKPDIWFGAMGLANQATAQSELDQIVAKCKHNQNSGRHDIAARILQEALVRYPWNYFLRIGLGISLFELEQTACAIEQQQLAVLSDPVNTVTWQYLAGLYRRLKMTNIELLALEIAHNLR